MGSLIKVILLYKEQYWRNKNFSGETLSDCYDSPVMNCFDDSRTNLKG
jgi:monoamine oxidase